MRKRVAMFRQTLEQNEVLDTFDRHIFESIVEKVIVGSYDSNGNKDPYMIVFVYKTGFKNSVDGKNFKPLRKNSKENHSPAVLCSHASNEAESMCSDSSDDTLRMCELLYQSVIEYSVAAKRSESSPNASHKPQQHKKGGAPFGAPPFSFTSKSNWLRPHRDEAMGVMKEKINMGMRSALETRDWFRTKAALLRRRPAAKPDTPDNRRCGFPGLFHRCKSEWPESPSAQP